MNQPTAEDGVDALKRAHRNAYRVFEAHAQAENSAGARMRNGPFCPVHHVAKFQLPRSALFFTTGSCFAREVELALTDLGIQLSSAEDFSYDLFSRRHGHVPGRTGVGSDAPVARPRSPINRYSPASMLYDIERVLERKHSFAQTIVPIAGGTKFWDPQIKNIEQGDLAFTHEMRGVLDRIIASITEADAVIMTLGMTETWVDSESGAVLPVPPGPLQIKRFPTRFKFYNAGYADVIATLDDIIAKIAALCPKKPRVVLTVSPVPMGSTFTDKDVIVANSRSKATLVSAAQATAGKYEHVDYFPSYEMVTHSSREIWYPDMVHIREQYVAEIMKTFISCYLPDGQQRRRDEQDFDRIAAQFEVARVQSGTGIFSDTSSLWRGQSASAPTYAQFKRMLAPDSPLSESTGLGKPMDAQTYAARHEDWVSRYAATLDPAELARWPEPTVGAPVVLTHRGFSGSLPYIRNFALASVVEEAVARHGAQGRGLKVLEIGAGYGGVGEILLRKGIAASFTDVDLPQNLFLAAQYLQFTFPERVGAVVNRGAPQEGLGANLRFLLPNDLALLGGEEFDLVINTFGLGEMPAATAQAYVAWISKHLAPGGLFISHNTHAEHRLPEVVQRQSAYGFQQLRLLGMSAQPSPVSLKHQTHSVMVLTRRHLSDPPFDDLLVDAFAGLMNIGLTAELEGPLHLFDGTASEAQRYFIDVICRMYEAPDAGQKYAIAAARVGDAACDAALEYIQGALAILVQRQQGCAHFAKYLGEAASPVAICYAIAAIRLTPTFSVDPALAQTIATARAKVPAHLARQIDGYTAPMELQRFILNLELAR